MLPIYLKEAAEYSLAVESAPNKPLELKKEPVFEWSNPARCGGQQGAVFVWLRDGRPAALGCIFSEPYPNLPGGGRKVIHELHALDAEKLMVTREGVNRWEPQAGLARTELADAGAPADTPAARLLQMRRLAQEFTGHSVDSEGKRWDLRLLPAPLYRYPAARTGAVDGAVFALVSNAGTDPEVLLVIEAREDAGRKRWEYACGRFSDWELRVHRKGKEVWSSVPGPTNPVTHDPKHTYRVYPDKVITPEGKLIARVRQTEKVWWGEVTPVEDK
jgi:hypothetical protein